MTIYTEVSIKESDSGFGMYQRGELQIGIETSYAFESDLIQAIAENSNSALPIEEALTNDEFIAAGVEDIRGLIYNEPSEIYAILNDERLDYIGIEHTEVADNFF